MTSKDPPNFTTRDPSLAEFWNERFAAGFMPWDAGRVPPRFAWHVATLERDRVGRVLVPGCGSGYELAHLAVAGYDALGIDISEAAIARAATLLGAPLAARVLRQQDFFALDARFDWIYERAFLAALPPERWPEWARQCARLLRRGGELAGYFFVATTVPQTRHGPPFVAARDELESLLANDFDCLADEPIVGSDSIAVFAGRERWMVWRRR
jgi:SAM-dependent methyltransferase